MSASVRIGMRLAAISTLGTRHIRPTAARSSGLKGMRLPKTAKLIAPVPMVVSSKVCPSGSARATNSPPTLPEAPGRLSTTTCWPSRAERRSAVSRPTKSVVPAGVKGMTRRMGRLDSPCAKAGSGNPAPMARAPKLRRVIMVFSLPVSELWCKVAREPRQINLSAWVSVWAIPPL